MKKPVSEIIPEIVSVAHNIPNCLVKAEKNKKVIVFEQVFGTVLGSGTTNKNGIAIIHLSEYSNLLKASYAND
jgi:hypothetical protein